MLEIFWESYMKGVSYFKIIEQKIIQNIFFLRLALHESPLTGRCQVLYDAWVSEVHMGSGMASEMLI